MPKPDDDDIDLLIRETFAHGRRLPTEQEREIAKHCYAEGQANGLRMAAEVCDEKHTLAWDAADCAAAIRSLASPAGSATTSNKEK